MPDAYSWINAVKDITVLLGAWVAIVSVDAWRRAFIMTRRLELAQEALALFHEACDIVEAIRSPIGCANEAAEREPIPDEPGELKDVIDRAYVIARRYESRAEMLGKARSLRCRALVQFGEDASAPFDLLDEAIRDIKHASRRLTGVWLQVFHHAKRKNDSPKILGLLEDADQRLYGDKDGTDPVVRKVEEAVALLERICREATRERGLLSWLNRPLGLTVKAANNGPPPAVGPSERGSTSD